MCVCVCVCVCVYIYIYIILKNERLENYFLLLFTSKLILCTKLTTMIPIIIFKKNEL